MIDVRTWFTDPAGISRPGKGFACTVKHLPRLIEAFTKAEARARELGLLDVETAPAVDQGEAGQ